MIKCSFCKARLPATRLPGYVEGTVAIWCRSCKRSIKLDNKEMVEIR